MKILLAIDGSDCSQQAVETVAQRPWPAGSQVKIISAVSLFVPVAPDPLVLYIGYRDEMLEAERKRARGDLNRAAERLRRGSCAQLQIGTKIVEGNPKRVIIEEGENWGADLIVVGSHGYTGAKRWLMGSVAQSVVTHAPCSVEIVRASALAEENEKERARRSLGDMAPLWTSSSGPSSISGLNQ